MRAALLHRILGAQGEDGEVLQGQHQLGESQVQLLREDLTDLVALVLYVGGSRLESNNMVYFTTGLFFHTAF